MPGDDGDGDDGSGFDGGTDGGGGLTDESAEASTMLYDRVFIPY